jgi:hypothetical protein
MSHLNKADLLLVSAQRFHDAIDPVSGHSENAVHAPVNQTFDEYISSSFGHDPWFLLYRTEY